MSAAQYSSVLFCCDFNAVRSPMAEGLMKKFYGHSIYVQSAGVRHDMEVDGFAIAVCEEIGVELTRHKARNFDEMEELGDAIDGFDLIVALSQTSHRKVLEQTKHFSVDVDFWPIDDPTEHGSTREQKLESYRQSRDQIIENIKQKFGSSS